MIKKFTFFLFDLAILSICDMFFFFSVYPFIYVYYDRSIPFFFFILVSFHPCDVRAQGLKMQLHGSPMAQDKENING